MTLTEPVKILDDRIKANKAQYELDREAAKISALSSGELEKYEYEYLGYKPDVIQKAKFKYSPLGKVFNKGLDKNDEKEGLLKRLKNIEGKNKDQLDAIKDQGEKQLDAIKNQGEKQLDAIERQKQNKLETTEKDEIVYLEEKIDELFEMFAKFFPGQSKTLLKNIAKNESSINYRNFSYEILLPNGRFHKFDLFKKYGTLYGLLKNLLTKKTIIGSANADQISFITDLMHGYDESKLTDVEVIKDEFYFYNAFLTKAKRVFLDTKKYPKKEFFPPKFKEYFPKDQKSVLPNALQLYNYRNKIIRINRGISPSMYALDAKSKPEQYDEAEKSEEKFDESIGESVKLRRQKAELDSEESAKHRRKIKGQGIKTLTPQQMLSRLPISLAQLKAGNNSEKLKNEIRQLLYSLYRSKS